MTDIRLNISWYNSLKRKALIRRLGHQGVTAIIDLWLYTAQHRPDGNLSGLSDEDIAEAAQYEGDFKSFILAIGPKPEGLGFLDGDSGEYKLHDWKEHNPWAYRAKARSRAAKRAVEERWRKERVMRAEYEANTERIQGEEQAHIPLSLPLPSPPPLSNSKDKDSAPKVAVKTKSKYNPVSRWCDFWKETFGEPFIVVPANAKHINDSFKALKRDKGEYERYLRNFFEDPWVQENRPGPDYFYRNMNKYSKTKPKDKWVSGGKLDVGQSD